MAQPERVHSPAMRAAAPTGREPTESRFARPLNGTTFSTRGQPLGSFARESGLTERRASSNDGAHADSSLDSDAEGIERAVRLWEHAGFKRVGLLPKAFRHPALGLVDALVMHRFL